MSDSLTGTLVLFTGATTPEHWMDCDGRMLQLQSNEALFGLLGWNYGRQDNSTFALPKMPKVGDARYIICVNGQYPSRP